MSTESRRRYPQAWTSALRTGPGWSRGAAASARGHGVRCEGPDSGQPTQTQEGSNRNANAAGRQDGQHWKTLSGGRGEGRTGLTRRRPEDGNCRYAVSAGADHSDAGGCPPSHTGDATALPMRRLFADEGAGKSSGWAGMESQ